MFQDHAIYARAVPTCGERAQRHIVMRQVSASELNNLVSGNTSLYWICFGISFGFWISLVGVCLAFTFANARIHATFLILCILSAILSSVFFGLAIDAHRKAKRKVKHIKETEIP